MDFITDLPPMLGAKGTLDTILVIVDRFTKYTHYVVTKKTLSSDGLATLFLEKIFA